MTPGHGEAVGLSIAAVTFAGLLADVHVHIGLEKIEVDTSHAANVAFEGFLVGMRAAMIS